MFIRYNNTAHYWEYDTSADQTGAGPWNILQIVTNQITGNFHSPITIDGPTISELDLLETGGSLLLRLINYQSRFQIYYNPVGPLFQVDLAGNTLMRGSVITSADILEKSRSVPLGHWTKVPGNIFVNSGSISISNFIAQGYTLIGKTIIYSFYMQVTVAGSPSFLSIALPSGITFSDYAGPIFTWGTAQTGIAQAAPNNNVINLYKDSGANPWPDGVYYISGTPAFPIN